MNDWRTGIPTREVVERQARPVDFDHPPMAAFMARSIGPVTVVIASWEPRESRVRFDAWMPFGSGTTDIVRVTPAEDWEFRPIDPQTGDPLPWVDSPEG